MISGFNTDVECAGIVYHVQTEDKGAPHNVIMSLVYDKGTILASKREPYDDDTASGQLKDRVNKQHKLICAAVKAGRIDDLKQMTAANRNGPSNGKSKERSTDPLLPPVIEKPTVVTTLIEAQAPFQLEVPVRTSSITTEAPAVAELPIQAPITILEAPIPEPVIDAFEIVEDYAAILPPDAVEVVSELSGQSRPTHQKLGIELIGEGKFRGGDRKTVNLMICRGSERKVVDGAQIMIKILGSAFRPVIFHARSDQNGLAKIHLQVPQFTAGRAALLVRASADGEETELRRVVLANS